MSLFSFSKSGLRLVTNKKSFKTSSDFGKASNNTLSYNIFIVLFTALLIKFSSTAGLLPSLLNS